MKFNIRLKRLREEKEVKQKQVADYIGVSERVYGYYEKDRFSKDPIVLQKLSEYFNVSLIYLIGISDDSSCSSIDADTGIVIVGDKVISKEKLNKIISFAELSGLLDD